MINFPSRLYQRTSLLVLLAAATIPPVVRCAQSTAETSSQLAVPETDEGLPGAGPIRRADWFRDVWLQRRSAWDKQAEQDRGAVVFLGDSITQGWGEQLEASFPGVKVVNRGISGDTTRGMLIRLEHDVLRLDPQAVVMLMGTNDLADMAQPSVVASNIDQIVDRLNQHNPQMPIVLCKVFPSSAEKDRPAARIRELNELIAKAVRDDPQVTLLDTWTLFANESGDAKIEEFPDLLHPNDAGYAKWAAALQPIFATRGLSETQADDFQLEPGFTSLFNGVDLTGWQYRPTSESMLAVREQWHRRDPNAPPWPVITDVESFAGKTQTPDGRFQVINGRLVVTTPTEGRKIQQLWTAREFPKDFTLRLEFRATPNADSGVFIRGNQLQCRDYLLAGPYKDLKQYRPLQWNELAITVDGNSAHCTCNGEVLEAALEVPANGPIGLEGDRGQVEYRRIRFREN